MQSANNNGCWGQFDKVAEALFHDLHNEVDGIWPTKDEYLPLALESAVFAIAKLAHDPINLGGQHWLFRIDDENPEAIWRCLVKLYQKRTDLSDVLRGWESPRMFENKYTRASVEFVW